MPKVHPDDRIAVDDVMPEGETLSLPDDWHKAFSELPKLYETPSSISLFLECPLRWFIERYTIMEREPPGFHAVLGSFVHRVLEVFYSEPPHYRDTELLSRVFRTAWDAIKQGTQTGIIPPGLQSEFSDLEDADANPDKMRGSFFKKARESIEAIEDFDGDPSHLEVVENEAYVKMEMNNVSIRGRVDRIVKGKLGGHIVQDYKTGNSIPGEDEPVDFLNPSFVPLGLYAYMVSRGNRPDAMDARVVRSAQLLYLPDRVKFNIKVRQENLQDVEDLIDRVTTEMNKVAETGKITVTPADTLKERPCTYCPVSGLCPAWNDTGTFQEMRDEVGI